MRKLKPTKPLQFPKSAAPAFEVLTGHASPYDWFGSPLPMSQERDQFLRDAIETARASVEEGFHRPLAKGCIPAAIDSILAEMWEQGWDPESGNLSLFATDFGLVLTGAILEIGHGVVVFRSEEDFRHLSIWWPASKLEVFPFRLALRLLQKRDGNPVARFIRRLSETISA